MKIIKLAQSAEYFSKLGIDNDLIPALLEYVLSLDDIHKKFILRNLRKNVDKINNKKTELLNDITYLNELFPFEERDNSLVQKIVEFAKVDEGTAKRALEISKEEPMWVAKMIANGSVHPGEDEEIVKELLAEFRTIKNSPVIPSEQKDIHSYETFGDLSEFVNNNSGKKSKRQEFKENSVAGAREVYNNNGVQVVEITTPEASAELCKGGSWCVKDPKFARQHLGNGPMYLFYIDGERSVLVDYPQEIKNKNNSSLKDYSIIERLSPILESLGIDYNKANTPDYKEFKKAKETGEKLNNGLKDPKTQDKIIDVLKGDDKGDLFQYLTTQNLKNPIVQEIADAHVTKMIRDDFSNYRQAPEHLTSATSEKFQNNISGLYEKTLLDTIETKEPRLAIDKFKYMPQDMKEKMSEETLQRLALRASEHIENSPYGYKQIPDSIKNRLQDSVKSKVINFWVDELRHNPDILDSSNFPDEFKELPVIKKSATSGWMKLTKQEPWRIGDVPDDMLKDFPEALLSSIMKDPTAMASMEFKNAEDQDPEYIVQTHVPNADTIEYEENDYDERSEFKEAVASDMFGKNAYDEDGEIKEEILESTEFKTRFEREASMREYFNEKILSKWMDLLEKDPRTWEEIYNAYQNDERIGRRYEDWYNEQNLHEPIDNGWRNLEAEDPRIIDENDRIYNYIDGDGDELPDVWSNKINQLTGKELEDYMYHLVNNYDSDGYYDDGFFEKFINSLNENVFNEAHGMLEEHFLHLDAFKNKIGDEKHQELWKKKILDAPEEFTINPLGITHENSNTSLNEIFPNNEAMDMLVNSWAETIKANFRHFGTAPIMIQQNPNILEVYKKSAYERIKAQPEFYNELIDDFKAMPEFIELFKNKDYWVNATEIHGKQSFNLMPEDYKQDPEIKEAYYRYYLNRARIDDHSLMKSDSVPEEYRNRPELREILIKNKGAQLAKYPYGYDPIEMMPEEQSAFIQSFMENLEEKYFTEKTFAKYPDFLKNYPPLKDKITDFYIKEIDGRNSDFYLYSIPEEYQLDPRIQPKLLEIYRDKSQYPMYHSTIPEMYKQDPVIKQNLTVAFNWYKKMKY